MTNSKDEIKLLVQNFLLDDERPLAEVTSAMAAVVADNSFEALGRTAFAAMLQKHTARLEASKATSIAKEPKGGMH
jgi:hypothetical protein